MEDVTQQTEQSLRTDDMNDSHNRLIILFGLLFVAIVFAIFFLNNTVDRAEYAVVTNSENMLIPVSTSTSDTLPEVTEETHQLAGYVAGIIPSPESDGKWIELQVQLPKAGTLAPEPNTEPFVPPEMETFFYKFYIGEDVEGIASIVGGENITVSFLGEPSETEYVVVREITL